ncbi:MAG TPA: ribosome-associated translation inhibitor RaiA [Phycisphaerales bacterium]|nr:ribosome-associated translation inhibitor RaiA [Phycisphaerales bacterium]
MRIEVSGKHLEVTPAIKQYAEEKCGKLPKFFDGVQEVFVVLENPRPDEFGVEIRADVVKHEDFIAKVSTKDLYEGIDLAVDKVARQLKDFKEKLRSR